MEKFASLIISGGATGVLYSLLAVGLVLAYTTTGIFNFAHGAIAFCTAYLFYELNTGFGWPTWLAGAVSILIFAPLLGLLLDQLLMRRLASTGIAAQIVGTVGVLIAVPALFQFIITQLRDHTSLSIVTNDAALLVPGLGPSPKTVWHITRRIPFDSDQLTLVVGGCLAIAALWLLLTRTRIGLEMRAAVDRGSLAQLRGVDTVRTSRVAWVLAALLAGLGGVLAAPNPAFGLNDQNYTLLLVIAATAAVFAKLRSFPIAFVAGIALGIVSNLVAGYLTIGDSIPGLKTSTPFWLLLVTVGVLGVQRGRRAGSVASERPPDDHASDLPPWRRVLPWAIAATLLMVINITYFDPIWNGVVVRAFALGLVFLSFVVVTGYGGMISLGQTAFVMLGGLMAGLLVNDGVPWGLAVVIAAATATALGVVFALPALRLGGVYLAIATLTLAFIGDRVLFQINGLRNGALGWTVLRPSIGPLDFNNDKTMAVLLLLIMVLASWVVINLRKSASGRSITAVRNAEPAATASGVSTVTARLGVFAVSAMIAGVGGAMVATVEGQFGGNAYPPLTGMIWLAVAALFGIRRPAGAALAGLAYFGMPRLLSGGIHLLFIDWGGISSTTLPNILFGLGAIGLAQEPEGMLADYGRQLRRRRDRRRAAAREAALEAPAAASASAAPASPASAGSPMTNAAAVTASSPRVKAPDTVLSLEGVRSGYGPVEVLHDVDLHVRRGSISAVLGANGAGKTTLCLTLAGLVPATAGTVTLDNQALPAGPTARTRAGVMLAPEARGVFPGLTIAENLELWLRTVEERERVYERFPILATRRSGLAGNLSGGEQQMLALAPALARPPRVLIVDEPTLGLAPLVVEELLTVFRELKASGVSLVLVEEKARSILQVADNVALLHLGRVMWEGPRSELSDDRLAHAYLGGADEIVELEPETIEHGTRSTADAGLAASEHQT